MQWSDLENESNVPTFEVRVGAMCYVKKQIIIYIRIFKAIMLF